MARKYDLISELYNRTCKTVVLVLVYNYGHGKLNIL